MIIPFAGEVSVKAVSTPGGVFVKGCSLTLASLTPGLDVAIAMGDFIGYIDEVRIWSRPHNPAIVKKNWRVIIDSDTSDISHSWTFNEGIGLIAYDDRSGDNFIIDDALNPPTWTKSDLDLHSGKYLKAPIMTTVVSVDVSQIVTAEEECNYLLGNFSLATGSSDLDDIMDVFKALCVQEMTSNNDTSQAESIIASASDLFQAVANKTDSPLTSMCNDVNSITDYIGAGGSNCTECVFGTVTSDVCECFETHWGASCDAICPVGPLGACNMFGICDSAFGVCNCFSRFFGAQISAVLYWSHFINTTTSAVMTSGYFCDVCATGWLGRDCYFAQATGLSSKVSIAFSFGSYLTLLHGVSFTFIRPGVYRLLQIEEVEIQALFLPCFGNHLCRYLQEISFKDAQSTISIQFVSGGNFSIVFDGEIIDYPSSKVSSSMSIDWSYKMLYPRVIFGGSSVLVFSSSLGLVTAFKIINSDSQSTTGLLGNSNGNWVDGLSCLSETQNINEGLLTGDYVGGCIQDRYTPSASETFIQHALGSEKLSSAGFVIHLQDQTFTVTGHLIQTDLSKFTFSFWAKLSGNIDTATVHVSVLTIETGSHTLEIISNNGKLEIDWDQLYETDKSFVLDKWTYIVITWASDGSWSVYLISEYDVIIYSGPEALKGSAVNCGTITVIGTEDIFIDIDYLRIWSHTKSLEEAVADMKVYSPSYCKGLLMVIMLDEGSGLTPSVFTFTAIGTRTSTAAIISGIAFIFPLTLFNLMDYPIHINTISTELSIICFKR